MNIVTKTIKHVQKYHPEIDRVTIWKDGRWQYSTDEHETINFSKDVDVSILENFADYVSNYYELPKSFQL